MISDTFVKEYRFFSFKLEENRDVLIFTPLRHGSRMEKYYLFDSFKLAGPTKILDDLELEKISIISLIKPGLSKFFSFDVDVVYSCNIIVPS